MKHRSIIDEIKLQFLSSSNGSILVGGFHPDLFLPLLEVLDGRIFLRISDENCGLVLNYFSSLWDQDSAVFIVAEADRENVPFGFDSQYGRFLSRSKELLATGTRRVDLIVCSESGLSVPILGSDVDFELSFDGVVLFEDCLSFLIKEDYVPADCVVSPGEYSVRGGIIDVFPRASAYPCRISFLDNIPSVDRFDANTQLSVSKITGFCLTSVSNNDLVALKDVLLDDFLMMSFSSTNELMIGSYSNVCKQLKLTTITHQEFCDGPEDRFKAVSVLAGLSSVGIMDENKDLFVPAWFLSREGSFNRVQENARPFVSLKKSEISKGDFLVHRDHGVCVCVGLTLQGESENKQEFLVLKYGDGGVVSVDVGRLDLITFHSPVGTEGVVLDSLSRQGGWFRKRASAKKRAEDVVLGLVDLYVNRNELFRAPFLPDIGVEDDFLSGFPFKETPDQVSAWDDISSDLSSSVPMDRLICGDVGFGKTELAIRAAFRVALSGRRTIVLAPTTILANQLYSSFSSRLDPFAVSSDLVSRYKSVHELDKIKQKIVAGKNNILIGTHAILNDDIYLQNIGLLIIDEEHRFGVKQKEKIRSYKRGIDILSMSATPIPRSINLALSSLCSISMLQTPPLLRRPIYTRVEYYNDVIIKSAIDFEVGRGGQVYFIHNDIANINNMVLRLRSLFPDFSVEFIHGQEAPSIIEKKMCSFVSGKIDILVCTSIIESGIDVPSANCIIINYAHLFGLSQLYQMRGRVGRGYQQAHAYLLLPRNSPLTNRAYRRIKTIEKNTLLGSGYSVALSDMEIRGSGSLFGYRQSGGAGSVGYEMYARLVQRALIDSSKDPLDFSINPESVSVIFFSKRFIPENFISVEKIRLSVYRTLSCAVNESELDDVLCGLADRFGPVPLPVINLVKESRLRLNVASCGIYSVVRRGCGLFCSIREIDRELFVSSILEFVEGFWGAINIKYHVLPSGDSSLNFCIHLLDDEDSYLIFSQFINKFKSLLETK